MEGYDPRYTYRDPGGTVRAFFIVILFFLTFLLFASGSVGNVDLTSNAPGSGQDVVQAAAPSDADPQVITIQDAPVSTNSGNLSIPVTGSCTNPYTVRQGDILSQIAVICDASIADIRRANPQITDVNLIYPGQQLVIPNTSVVPVQPTAAPVRSEPGANIAVPVTGLYPVIRPGAGLQVRGIGYPANTPVNIAIGPQNAGYTVITSGVTDANGNLTTRITVPNAPDSQIRWVVVVATTGQPPIQAISQPFTIAGM
jgi:LysM repeat protein